MTKTTLSGRTAAWISFISSKSASSCDVYEDLDGVGWGGCGGVRDEARGGCQGLFGPPPPHPHRHTRVHTYLLVPPRGVDDDHLVVLLPELRRTLLRDAHGVRLGVRAWLCTRVCVFFLGGVGGTGDGGGGVGRAFI